ncbi:MAG: hypothetical protein K5897_10260 [Eubacterium sp.]|nr:hypothetical protein [Eubacterium sp.]
MKCKICGGEIAEGASVCPICGMSVAASEAAANAAAKAMSTEPEPAKAMATEPEPAKNKYSMVGGNVTASNPFGMDPNNQEAREAQAEARRELEREAGMEARIVDEPGFGQSSYGGAAYGGAAFGSVGNGGAAGGPVNGGGPDLSAFDSRFDPFAAVSNSSASRSPMKKDNKTLIIIITIGCCLLAILVVLWKRGILGGNHGANGTYKFVNATTQGMTLTPAQFKEFGMDVDDFELKISGSTATVRLMGRSGKCTISISGSTITFKDSQEEFEGTYNKEEGTISIENDGVVLNFKK